MLWKKQKEKLKEKEIKLKKKKRILVKIIKIGKFDWNGIKFCNDTLDEFCGQKKLKMLMKSTFGGSY